MYFVYVVTNQHSGTLYTGVTGNLMKRIAEHRRGIGSAFTTKHVLNRFVWYENYENIEAAITREKQIKKWNRQWKIGLVEKYNPDCKDLYADIEATHTGERINVDEVVIDNGGREDGPPFPRG